MTEQDYFSFPVTYDSFQHREDGRVCIQFDDGTWFHPLSAGGEGFECERVHGETVVVLEDLERDLFELMIEWDKTCEQMNLPRLNRDMAAFIAAAIAHRVRPAN